MLLCTPSTTLRVYGMRAKVDVIYREPSFERPYSTQIVVGRVSGTVSLLKIDLPKTTVKYMHETRNYSRRTFV